MKGRFLVRFEVPLLYAAFVGGESTSAWLRRRLDPFEAWNSPQLLMSARTRTWGPKNAGKSAFMKAYTVRGIGLGASTIPGRLQWAQGLPSGFNIRTESTLPCSAMKQGFSAMQNRDNASGPSSGRTRNFGDTKDSSTVTMKQAGLEKFVSKFWLGKRWCHISISKDGREW